jgi:hypothetical protein
MKTPREILLTRHQAARPKLDAIRRTALKEMNNEATKKQRRPSSLVSLFLGCSQNCWRELIWPCRRTWAGLAAAWVVLLVFNLSHSERAQIVTAKAAPPPGELRLAFQEQRRVLEELIGPTLPPNPAAPPHRPKTQPRSERRSVALA